LLHTGNPPDGARLSRGNPVADRVRDPRDAGWKPVPVHGLPLHRRGRRRRGKDPGRDARPSPRGRRAQARGRPMIPSVSPRWPPPQASRQSTWQAATVSVLPLSTHRVLGNVAVGGQSQRLTAFKRDAVHISVPATADSPRAFRRRVWARGTLMTIYTEPRLL